MQMWRPMHRRMFKDTKRIVGMNRVSLQEETSGKQKDLEERKTKECSRRLN